jgi:hypothetical protein
MQALKNYLYTPSPALPLLPPPPPPPAHSPAAKGISLKKLTFDQSNATITYSRVCRQLTPDEAAALLAPGADYKPVDVYEVVLPLLPEAAAEAGAKVGGWAGGRVGGWVCVGWC